MPKRRPLEPHIPLHDLKKVIAKIVAVGKPKIEEPPEGERPKRKRRKKPTA